MYHYSLLNPFAFYWVNVVMQAVAFLDPVQCNKHKQQLITEHVFILPPPMHIHVENLLMHQMALEPTI